MELPSDLPGMLLVCHDQLLSAKPIKDIFVSLSPDPFWVMLH
jgi:hypothetical protein